MAVIDIVFILILIISALHSSVRGFVSEVIALVAAILGILSAVFFFRAGATLLRNLFMGEIKILPEIIAFIVILCIVFILIKFIGMIVKGIIEGIRLGWLDRFLGFLYGCAKGILVICLLLLLINVLPFIKSGSILNKSFFAELLLPFIIGERNNSSADTVAFIFGIIKDTLSV